MTFNPQARRYDTDNLFDDDGLGTNNEWVDLQPLGTEGQFSDQYPEKEPYSLTQFTVPLGIGFKLSMGEKLSIIAEYGIRKTFTDYLDDVGGTYANPIHLLSDPNNGQIAASFSDRSLDFYLWALNNYGAQSPEEAEQYIAMWNGNYDNQTQTGNLRSNPKILSTPFSKGIINFCLIIILVISARIERVRSLKFNFPVITKLTKASSIPLNAFTKASCICLPTSFMVSKLFPAV